MILYFSGTGNSKYVAQRIGEAINDDIVNLFSRIQNKDHTKLISKKAWVIVCPTYAWQIPHIVKNWLEQTPLNGNKDIYFVMTCGSNIANAQKYLKELCAYKNMNFKGCMEIVMPENYIALFKTPTKNEALDIIKKAEPKIDKVIEYIQTTTTIPCPNISVFDKLSSGLVNDIFYPMIVHAKKFYTTDQCIACGKCVTLCPLSNIHMENRKPVWRDHCTHCMACISYCPTNAIEYGKHSKNLPRYTFPK